VSPGSLLLRALWFLLRLVIYLVTGHWVGGPPNQATPSVPQAAPQAAPRPPLRPPSETPRVAPEAEKKRLSRWVEAARARLPELYARARLVPAGAPVLAALEQAIAPELERLRARLTARDMSPDPFSEITQALDDALGAAEASLEARRDVATAGMLADTEAIAIDLLEPLQEHLYRRETRGRRQLLALPHTDMARTQRIAAHTRLVVMRGHGNEPERIASEARVLARLFVDDQPALVDDLRAKYQLPPRIAVPPAQGFYAPEQIVAAPGVWLPELWADVLATFTLGPAYAVFVAAALARPQAPLEARVAYLHGRFLSVRLPSLVRMHVIARALTELGFTSLADTLWKQFVAVHGEETLYFPRQDGSVVAVPTSFVLGELEPVLVAMLEEPHRALLDHALIDVPGFAYLHGEDGEARTAAQKLANGSSVAFAPRIVAAAALLAVQARPDRRADIVDALARSVRGAGTLEPLAAAPGKRPGALPRDLKAMAHDRAELRAALTVGAIFARPPGLARSASGALRRELVRRP
jgi:hypothetical protein